MNTKQWYKMYTIRINTDVPGPILALYLDPMPRLSKGHMAA